MALRADRTLMNVLRDAGRAALVAATARADNGAPEKPVEKPGSGLADSFLMTLVVLPRSRRGVCFRFAARATKRGSEGESMPRKRPTKNQLPILQPYAAGVDVAAEEIFVRSPPIRDPEPVRRFRTFTPDLHELADWLTRCGIRSVAMESTSVYWIPLHQILEERGFEIYLVNAHYLKNVPGRKSDASDCQWIQYLHSVGLLRASFRPPAEICAVRSL